MERYGLFMKSADGSPLWVCAEEDLAQAVAKIRDLDRQTGLEHFIFEFRSAAVVTTSRDLKVSQGGYPDPHVSSGATKAE
ncbi:MAG TPA: hypothetical protein VG860_08130 [Terriglobia bacterium]|jgi:hypothetical protein|nr:hypothetical protein [Terriglobia bacterium]